MKSLHSTICQRLMGCVERERGKPVPLYRAQVFMVLVLILILIPRGGMGASVAESELESGSEEEFSFDVEKFEKKELEWGGFVGLKWDHADIDKDSALYALNKNTDKAAEDKVRGSLQITGQYSKNIFSLHWTLNGYIQESEQETDHTADVYETYVSLKPTPLFSAGMGKKSYKWGKGYAWNPVGFINRPKDPNDPEEAMEGFVVGEADLIKSFSGLLQTVALTTVLIPVRNDLNDDFGQSEHINLAAKLYLLYQDTDLDFIVYTGNSRSTRFGMDFARNLATNFEFHGELAYIPGLKQTRLEDDGAIDVEKVRALSWLLGVRYLSENNITSIVEYYGNNGGLTSEESKRFYELIEQGDGGDSSALEKAGRLAHAGYIQPQPGRNYLYLRCTQKEPLGILYYTPGITSIINLDDGSFSLTPELVYDGWENWELRTRFSWLQGGRDTEYGEKSIGTKLELRARYYF